MNFITAAVVAVIVIAFLFVLAVQVGEARTEEARASWLASPQGQAWIREARAESLWRDVFDEVSLQTGGNFVAACLAAEAAAKPCFDAAREAANKG